MINKNETMHPLETAASTGRMEEQPSALLTHERVKEVIRTRTAMLSTIKQDIGTRLYDVLTQKIEHEKASLLRMVDDETKRAEMKRRLNKVLRGEYFIQKPLDTHLF